MTDGSSPVVDRVHEPYRFTTRVGDEVRTYVAYPNERGTGLGCLVRDSGRKGHVVAVDLEGYEHLDDAAKFRATATEQAYRDHMADFIDSVVSPAWPEND